jgi:ubiquinone/menaquinone biosynthesis C-methylase UbiE
MPNTRRAVIAFSVVLLTIADPLWAQETKQSAAPAAKKKVARRARSGRPTTYMGRPIAPVMTYEGADWLVRDSREQEEEPEAMLDALKIQPGETVADVGAGVGYTSVRLARRVGPKGRVLASDIQPEMLRMLAANMRSAGIKNVSAIRGTITDPKLPEGEVDLALMVDVYHECPDPEATVRGIRRALRPKGRLVLVEFRGEDPDVPIKPEHKMTLAQVRRELEPQGFDFKANYEFLPWQHIIVFEKAAEKKSDGKTPAGKKADEKTSDDKKAGEANGEPAEGAK